MRRGYDLKRHPPGLVEEEFCSVCETKMDVTRDVKASRGFAAAMGGSNWDRDEFRCPEAQEAWHRQALEIIREAENTASSAIEKILLDEKDDIVKQRKATKVIRVF